MTESQTQFDVWTASRRCLCKNEQPNIVEGDPGKKTKTILPRTRPGAGRALIAALGAHSALTDTVSINKIVITMFQSADAPGVWSRITRLLPEFTLNCMKWF